MTTIPALTQNQDTSLFGNTFVARGVARPAPIAINAAPSAKTIALINPAYANSNS